MTCLELYKLNHPDNGMTDHEIWVNICPHCSGGIEIDEPEGCTGTISEICCVCWNREVPEFTPGTSPHIKDSGDRTEFSTGAVRDMRDGKGRCDLMPLDVVARVCASRQGEADSIIDDISLFQEFGDIKNLYFVLHTVASKFGGYETMLLEVSKHFEEGAKKYGENNWQKGIPVRCYVDSAVRHYLKWLRGDTDEPHDRAFVWNILCCIWTCEHKPELNNYAGGNDNADD